MWSNRSTRPTIGGYRRTAMSALKRTSYRSRSYGRSKFVRHSRRHIRGRSIRHRRTYRRRVHRYSKFSSKRHGTQRVMFKRTVKAPSRSFKEKVQQSLSPPYYYSVSTGNVIIPFPGGVGWEPAKAFQPYDTSSVGSGPKVPNPVICRPVHLFAYKKFSQALVNFLPGIGTVQKSYNQKIYVSGHLDYTLVNTSTDTVTVEVIRWTIKKDVPIDFCAMWGTTTDPVPEGNILNFLGYCFEAEGYSSSANANNAYINRAELRWEDLPVWTEYVKTSTFKVKMKPGAKRHFSVGCRKLIVDTSECYNYTSAVSLDTEVTWAKAFIPGATGLLFRAYGSPAQQNVAHVNFEDAITYTTPEFALTTRLNYTLYDWADQVERTAGVIIAGTGIGSTPAKIVNEVSGAVETATNA